jgi:hypothetical protein
LCLTLWFAAAVWAFHEMQAFSGGISWARVVFFSGFLILATLETAPNVSQSLYWQTAAITYIAPLIPLWLYVAVMVRGARERQKKFWYWFKFGCAGILIFIAGGFSDAYVVMQAAGFAFVVTAVETLPGVNFKSKLRPFLLIGLAASLLALIIVAFAPGTSVRQSHFPQHPGAWDILRLGVSYSVRFAGKLILTHPLISLISLTLPLLIVLRDFSQTGRRTWDRRICVWLLLITPATVFLLILAGTAPAIYAMSQMLPDRSRVLLSLVFICGTLLWSRAAGEYLAGKFLTIGRKVRQISASAVTVALLLIIIFPQISTLSILGLRYDARNFAADWDRQDLELKSAKQNGITEVEVPQIGDFQSRIGKGPSDLHLRTDPTFWINRVTASYYGLTSVRAKDEVVSSH